MCVSVSLYVESNGESFVYTIGVPLLGLGMVDPSVHTIAKLVLRHPRTYTLSDGFKIPSLSPVGFAIKLGIYKFADAGLFVEIAAREANSVQGVVKEMKQFGLDVSKHHILEAARMLEEAWQRSQSLLDVRLVYVGAYCLENHFV